MHIETIAEKVVGPLAGFFGAVVMLTYMDEASTRRWMSALLAAVLSAYFVPPIVLSWMKHSGITWLPHDYSAAGLLGLTIGMLAIYLVGAMAMLGRHFAEDPIGFFLRLGRKP